jgi:hypothetical protein
MYFLVQFVMWFLGKSLQVASKQEKGIQEELAMWPENFRVLFKINPKGPFMRLRKIAPNRIALDKTTNEDNADLIIYFKNLHSAVLVFTAQKGVPWAFAEHRMAVKGDLPASLSLIRCLNRVQTILFPYLIANLIMKKVPHISFIQKSLLRLRIYTVGITLGI